LVDAKTQLLHNVENLKSTIKLPHVPQRCNGDRVVHVVDDICVILACLDAHLQLKSLPKYVTEGPDSIPSSRLYEGDMSIFWQCERGWRPPLWSKVRFWPALRGTYRCCSHEQHRTETDRCSSSLHSPFKRTQQFPMHRLMAFDSQLLTDNRKREQFQIGLLSRRRHLLLLRLCARIVLHLCTPLPMTNIVVMRCRSPSISLDGQVNEAIAAQVS